MNLLDKRIGKYSKTKFIKIRYVKVQSQFFQNV